jgi:hypothetical protein
VGFRYRKSINIGGGFRINVSKSGIGYSWGTKGYRVTKKSNGGTRTTVSIPGTGLSWVNETGGNKRQRTSAPSYPSAPQPAEPAYMGQPIVNGDAEQMVSAGLEDLLDRAATVVRTHKRLMTCFWISLVAGVLFPAVWILSAILLLWAVIYKKNGVIQLDYAIDDDCREEVNAHLAPLLRAVRSEKVWRITQSAGTTVQRVECVKSTTVPYPFATNETVASFTAAGETLLFLPDKMLVIQGDKFGALHYSDVTFSSTTTRFVETQWVPRDAMVVEYRWEHATKSGEPDRRYKNNRQIPICQYGELHITSHTGLNIVLMFSNVR